MKLIQLKTLNITMVLLASSFMTLLAAEVKITKEEAKQIAKGAYVYGFPMVVNYKTMVAYTLDKNSPEFKGDFNELACAARVYTPDDKAIVTPNSDTPYCMGWMDIRKDPIVISGAVLSFPVSRLIYP